MFITFIRLFYLENGLQVTSKNFEEIEKIYSLEFIDSDEKLLIIGEGPEEGLKFVIWDLYDTGKVESTMLPIIKDLDACLARTSGNVLQVDDEGKVRSVLKRIELLEERKKEKVEKELEKELEKNSHIEKLNGTKLNGEPDESHTIYFDDKSINTTFKPIVIEKEPWISGDYERNSYCLYHNKEGSETETLQLLVGRTTVQIWNQVQNCSKNKDELPNKGEPFLEYIWTNRIPVNQEREKTRLQIEKFEYETNDELHDKLTDFSLKVYWYERIINNNKENVKKEEHKIIEEDDKEIDKMKEEKIKKSGNMRRWEKTIKRKDIIEKFHAVRHACKALEHLNKRYKSKYLVDNYIRVHEVS